MNLGFSLIKITVTKLAILQDSGLGGLGGAIWRAKGNSILQSILLSDFTGSLILEDLK